MKDDTRKLTAIITAWVARDDGDKDIYIYFVIEPEYDDDSDMWLSTDFQNYLSIIDDAPEIPMKTKKEVKVYINSNRSEGILGSFIIGRRRKLNSPDEFEYYIPNDDYSETPIDAADIVENIDRFFKDEIREIRCVII